MKQNFDFNAWDICCHRWNNTCSRAGIVHPEVFEFFSYGKNLRILWEQISSPGQAIYQFNTDYTFLPKSNIGSFFHIYIYIYVAGGETSEKIVFGGANYKKSWEVDALTSPIRQTRSHVPYNQNWNGHFMAPAASRSYPSEIALPSMVTAPLVACKSRVNICNVVDLPAPFIPEV